MFRFLASLVFQFKCTSCRVDIDASAADCDLCPHCCKTRNPLHCARGHARFCARPNCISPVAKEDCVKNCCAPCCVELVGRPWCPQHSDKTLCRQCVHAPLTCDRHLCKTCCQRNSLPCVAHGTVCRSQIHSCRAPPSTKCAARICASCPCHIPWCVEHGNPSLCHSCGRVSHTADCLWCLLCGKRQACRCKSHQLLCASHSYPQLQLCLATAMSGCDAHCCSAKCCTTVWCRVHGDPSLCHICGDEKADNRCVLACCAVCCKASMTRCVRHDAECRACGSQRGARCDIRCCGRCCKLAWCAAHGNPRVCHRCCRKDASAGCVGHLCVACCAGCRVHARPARRCRQCSRPVDSARDDGCQNNVCANCCDGPCQHHHGQRWFGSFICVCGNRWSSGFAYRGLWQQCRKCGAKSMPKSVDPLKKSEDRVGNKLPHDSARCQKCIQFGPCQLHQ